ncbi:hypothetical protein AAFF39_04985 [Lactococcus garvieae]
MDAELQAKVMKKNIYEGYSEANWVSQSHPEKLFEQWLENSDKVKWWYRSFDRGEKYFSIAFGAKKKGSFQIILFRGLMGLFIFAKQKVAKTLILMTIQKQSLKQRKIM